MPSQARRGYSIRIFLPDGIPDGLRLVEKSNWTGHGIVCPRSQFRDAKARPEFGRTGVYVLLGPSEAGGLPTVYVGEGDPALDRLDRHLAEKDFWTSLVLFTSKDENLNKAHVQYLEPRLVDLAQAAKRCVLDNVHLPQLPSLSEPDVAEMDGFLEEMLLIYPVLGVTVFERPAPAASGQRVLYLRARGVEARGYETAAGFVVLAGSQMAKDPTQSIHGYLQDLRDELVNQGIIVASGDVLRLTQDYTFGSPSTASGVMLGRSSNGREEWKDESGRSLKQLQSATIATVAPD